MIETRSLRDNTDDFNKLLLDLENIGIKIEDEDKAIILLNPKSYSTFVETLKYARDSLSLNDVQKALRSKEVDSLNENQTQSSGENLMVRGRPETRSDKRNPRSRSRSKSKNKYTEGKCFHCHKEGHFRRDCPERKKSKENLKSNGELSLAQDDYESAEVLCITSEMTNESWVMDSGCSFHICPSKISFETYKEVERGEMILGNNKTCKIRGIGEVRLHDSTELLLSDVRYVPELKRNLISLGALDNIGCTFKSGKMKTDCSKRVSCSYERKSDQWLVFTRRETYC